MSNQIDIINIIEKAKLLKSGKIRTESFATLAMGILSGAISLGWFDITPEEASQIVHNTGQAVSTGKDIISGNVSLFDGILRIVALIIGGQVVTAYVKGRSDTKTAQITSIIQAIVKEMELKKGTVQPDTLLNEASAESKGGGIDGPTL